MCGAFLFLSLYLFCSGFLRNFFHLFAVITLWVATVLAFLGEWKQPGQGMAKIGYAIIAVIVVSGLFSFGQEYVSSEPRTLAALRKLLPQEVDVMRDGKVTSPAVEQLVPGDIVLLERCGYNYALKPPTKSFEGVSRPASTQVLGGQMSTDESEVATTPPALSLKERR